MRIFIFLLGFGVAATLFSCKPRKDSAKQKTYRLDTTDIFSSFQRHLYRSSRPRHFDILHNRLEVSFDWKNKQVQGKAFITLKPYFYPCDTVVLDAKGFEFHEVALVENGVKKNLQYMYEKDQVSIHLGKEYLRTDTLVIFIDYTATPSKQSGMGSWAISDSKGLYFIIPDSSDPGKPHQIWTQGETENNSCWFPTFDSPNERMTQEIYITVDTGFVTLSNGLLIYSKENGDGTRTDYWKQSLPHAPYLTMMAVGKYAIVRDNWRGMDVSYYVEPDYEQYAHAIFGNTPEMIEFFSKTLGVPYPWEKYAQVAVRDFVSGAMENVSATIHGEFIQRNHRELLDENYEDYISHELFHQWFGDLVTCESWANLPLNESFATYGEYLWREYKYGRDDADDHLDEDLQSYLREAKRKKADLIRFDYSDREDMFDSHSYAKGGRVLHMLRYYIGDEAFFKALNYYLETNRYSSVEIHDLRLAFEKITGQDLNWFFNQWFLSKGHPELIITYSWNDSLKKQSVMIGQLQDQKLSPLYRLPVTIDIYFNGGKTRHKVEIRDVISTFSFQLPGKPDLVNVDAEKVLLCTKIDLKNDTEWLYQYYNAPLYLDRAEAFNHFTSVSDTFPLSLFTDALSDKHWSLRLKAVENLKKAYAKNRDLVINKLADCGLHDEKAKVRAAAIRTLSDLTKPGTGGVVIDEKSKIESTYKNALNDRSYSVVGEALLALTTLNPSIGISITKPFEDETNENIMLAVARIYSAIGTEEQSDFFRKKIASLNGHKKTFILQEYADFLVNQEDETIDKGLPILEEFARNEPSWWRRIKGLELIEQIYDEYDRRETQSAEKLKKTSKSNDHYEELKQQLQDIREQKEKVYSLIALILNDEKDQRVKMIYRHN